MGEAFLDYKKGGSGLNINGIIEDYYVYAGANVSAGDFVEFVNGVAGKVNAGTSSPVKLNTITYPSVIRTLLLSENRVFVAYGKSSVSGTGGTKSISAVICDVSGNTITPYTDTVIVNLTSGNSIGSLGIALLSNGSIMLAHDGTTNNRLYAVVCTINGTTITASTDTQLSSQSNSGYNASCATLENNSVFVAHAEYNGYNVSGLVCTVSGTTITAGTDTKVTTTNNNDSNTITQTIYLGENKVCITFPHKIDSVSNTLCGMVCTVSGTAITGGTTTQLSSIQYSGWVHSTALLDKNKLFSVHGSNSSSSSSYLYGIVFNVSGTTITKGADTQLSSIAYSCNAVALPLKSGKVFIAYNGNTDSIYLYGMVAEINNTTIIANTETLLGAGSYNRHTISTILAENENIFIANQYEPDYLLQVQVFSVDETNNIPTNQIIETNYETQVRPATSLPCKGVAKSSGEGGDETGHKDMVSVYVPDVPTYIDFSNSVVPTTWVDSSDYLSATATNEYGEWSVEATNIYMEGGTTGYPPSKAFDELDYSAYMTNSWSNILDKVYLYLNCPNGVSLNPSAVTIYHGNCGNSSYNLSKLQAYNGSEWVELATLTSSASTTKTDTFNLSEKEYYTAFRIEVTPGVQGNRSTVYDFKITSGTLKIE